MKIRFGREFWINSSLCCISILFCLSAMELTARYIINKKFPLIEYDIRRVQEVIRQSFVEKPLFKPHPYLSYAPSDIEITGDGCIIAGQKFTFTKPPDVLRVACLGGSTTMRAYPKMLKKALGQCFPEKKIEVMDWGCSNWSIMESMINYMVRARLFRPDVVISHEGVNDIDPRLRKNFSFDYSHYRKAYTLEKFLWRDTIFYRSWLVTWLRLRAGRNVTNLTFASVKYCPENEYYEKQMPPESSSLPYRESLDAIAKITKSDGAVLILAGMIYDVSHNLPELHAQVIEQHNTIARDYAKKEGLLYVDMQHHLDIRKEYFVDHVHLTGIGDQMKGFLLASAVAMVKEGTPCVWVSDSVNESGVLKENVDYDEPGNRSVVIHWNSYYHDVKKVTIGVRKNGGAEKRMITLNSTFYSSFNWFPGDPSVEASFRNGPEFGNIYEFTIYTEGSKGPCPPLLMVNPIRYEKNK